MLAGEISQRLSTRAIGRALELHDSIDSTNLRARALGDEGAPHGTLVLALRQLAGRGRRGRTWSGLPGPQLFASFLLRPKIAADRASELTPLTAVALAETLDRFGAHARIKWPNDLELDGRKVAGILAELATDPDGRLKHVVVGIGVNLSGTANDFPEELRDRATTIEICTGVSPALAVLVPALCERLEAWLDRHEHGGFQPVLDLWRARSSTLGQQVRVILEGREIKGNAIDLDFDGALIVSDDIGSRHRVVAGEVVHLRPA